MYEIGAFAVIGAHETEPDGFMPIRLLPHVHPNAHPWWSESTQAVLGAMVADGVDLAGKRVLDFGCGASAILAIAAARLGADVTAVEIHPELAALARQQIAANGLRLEVLAATDEAFDFALVNVGDAGLVGRISNQATHGVGTDAGGGLVTW